MGNHNLWAGRWGARLTCSSSMTEIVRAQVAHTPCNPFVDQHALQAFSDGAMAFADGRIMACGAFGGSVRGSYPDASVVDARDAILLPGFVDCHVHFPQIRLIGALGLGLMDWLRSVALPEEARLADPAYASGRRSVRHGSGSQRDDDCSCVRFALRRGSGRPVLRGVGPRPARDERACRV